MRRRAAGGRAASPSACACRVWVWRVPICDCVQCVLRYPCAHSAEFHTRVAHVH